MKAIVLAMALMTLAATAFAGPDQKAKEVRGEGCVQAGVEARCLVLKDLRSGKLYNLLAKEPRPQVGDGIEFTAAALWLAAWAGESAAAFQLQRFKSNPANRGSIRRVGLWRYSRHPNYFFEWLI